MSQKKEEPKCIGCRILGGPLCILMGLAFQIKNRPYVLQSTTQLAKLAYFALPAGLYISGFLCTYSLYSIISQESKK